VPTPVSDGKHIFVVDDRGVVHCLDAKTGQIVWGPERLKPGTYSASPVLAEGRIYVTNEDGLTSVFAAGPKFEVLGGSRGR
jgi:outer membrane protein assembly factor BamB